MSPTTEKSSRFIAARRTAELVGREEEMQKISAILSVVKTHPRVVAIYAEGGIGKTRLLQAALTQAQMPTLDVATDLVDLYHAPTHTENGLADAIYRVLKPGERRFANYWKERRHLERLRLTGEVTGVEEQRRKALRAFDEDMQALAQERTIVLALDTAENFIYDRDLRPDAPRQIAQSFVWLCTRLPQWQNVILLIAGRPASRTLFERMEETYGLEVKPIELPPLDGGKCIRYFNAVQALAREEGDLNRAELIERLPDEDRLRAGQLAEGRPVLLALLIDLMTVASVSTIKDLLKQVERTVADSAGVDARHALEGALVKRLKEATGRLGDTVEMVGRARKGVDKTLAAKLLDVSEQEAFLRLGEAKRMSFVKVRPEDDRVFLHDEVYDILDRALYHFPEDEVTAEEASNLVFAHYEERIKAIQKKLEGFWAPVELEGAGRIDLEALSELTDERVNLITEILYYRLRQKPGRGLLRYFRYMHEAILSGDVLLDMQLQAELMAFLGASNQLPAADAKLAHALLAVHPVLRLWAEQDYGATDAAAARIHTEEGAVLAAAAPHAVALMDAWLAYSSIYQGSATDMAQVEQTLQQTIQQLERWGRQPLANELPETDVTQWIAKAVRAFALRVFGYLEWERGRMRRAIHASRSSAQLWRDLNLRVEMATTLNDMGFAMSEEGEYADARALVEDALEIRRRLGPRAPVALSLNTMALIEVHEGNYGKALEFSGRALAIFRALNDDRGIGLALIALSEATRRSVDDVPQSQYEARIARFRAARDHAREAVEIFERLGETIRQVEALLEVGCACRDWVEQIKKRDRLVDPTEALIQESSQALWDAYQLSEGRFPRYQLDAVVDLTWLGLYTGNDEILREADKTADSLIGPEYRLQPQNPQPSIDGQEMEQKTLWPEIGKLYAQRGHRRYRQFEDERSAGDGDKSAILHEAAENFWYGLQYSVFYTGDYHNLRREKDRIYRSFKSLNEAELQEVLNAVREKEQCYGYGEAKKSAFREFLENRALWHD